MKLPTRRDLGGPKLPIAMPAKTAETALSFLWGIAESVRGARKVSRVTATAALKAGRHRLGCFP